MIISGVSPDPSGIGSSGISNAPSRGVAARERRTRRLLAAKPRSNKRSDLKLRDITIIPPTKVGQSDRAFAHGPQRNFFGMERRKGRLARSYTWYTPLISRRHSNYLISPVRDT